MSVNDFLVEQSDLLAWPLYVNDHGEVTCYVGGCDWTPREAGRRTTVEGVLDSLREHISKEHSGQGPEYWRPE